MSAKTRKSGNKCPLCGSPVEHATHEIYKPGRRTITPVYLRCHRCYWQDHHDAWEERTVADAGNHKRDNPQTTHNLDH